MQKTALTSAVILLGCLLAMSGSAKALDRDSEACLDLNGPWQFRLDPADEGVAGRWFTVDVAYPDTIQVPGNWQTQGFGPPDGHLRHNYQGRAWYRRAVAVPSTWAGKRIWIHLGGVANTAEVYVNGTKVGTVESYTVPHEFDITDRVKPGAENTIVCHVDSTSLAQKGLFNFMARWGGLYREVHLEARFDPAITDVFVIPDVKNRTARVQVELARCSKGPAWKGPLRVRIAPAAGGEAAEGEGEAVLLDQQTKSDFVTVPVAIPDMRTWSPEDPFLYRVEVTLLADGMPIDTVRDRFGMRQFEAGPGGTLLLNGRPYFVRGLGDDTVEVITGTQRPDKQVYVDRLRLIKQYGFNGVRFLGNTPIPEYFDAADEVGVLVMAEGHEYSRDKATIPLLRQDVARIARAYRNHPSWYIWSAGNELFACEGASPDREWMDYLLFAHEQFKRDDPTRFFVASDGTDVFPTDIITKYPVFDGVRPTSQTSEQPFDGLIDEVACFTRALDAAEMARVADNHAEEYAKSVLLLGPSGYWRLEETSPGDAVDSSGNHRDGLYDATVKADDLGLPGAMTSSRALRVSATSKGVRLSQASGALFASGNEPFSVSLWVCPNRFGHGDFGTPFALGVAEPGAALLIAEDGALGTGKLRLGQYQHDVLVSNAAIVAGQWNHVGVTYDGKRLDLYLNGKLDTQATINLAIRPAEARIGASFTAPVTDDKRYSDRPQIWHEFPNTYIGPLPDLTIRDRLTGVYQDPNALANAQRQVDALGLQDRYASVRSRSLDLFYESLKGEFERARLSPTMDGYCYWCMTDFPAGPEGEGTTYGLFSMLYEPEKFPDPKPILSFNRETVLLADAGWEHRVVEAGTARDVTLSVSHYGAEPIQEGRVTWKLAAGDRVIAQDIIEPVSAAVGEVRQLATISLRPTQRDSGQRLRLDVRLQSKSCSQANHWDFWTFPNLDRVTNGKPILNRTGARQLDARYGPLPDQPAASDTLVVADRVTPELIDDLAQGRRVLLLAEQDVVARPGAFSFWPQWIRSSGTLIENHAALESFPHGGFCNLQFYRLFGDGLETLVLGEKGMMGGGKLAPIVWGLSQDHDPSLGTEWFVPKNRWKMVEHGLICEGCVENARILICTLRVVRGIQSRQPEAAALLDSLVAYANSDRFAPKSPPMTMAEFHATFKTAAPAKAKGP